MDRPPDGAGGGSAPPRRADARRNRERVVRAATEAFAAEGMSVSMESIARRAGVGVGTIYRQFPSKELLYTAVVRHGLEQVIERARELSTAEDPGAAFFDFVGVLLDAVAAKRDLVETLEQAGGDVKASLADVSEAWLGALSVLVARAQSVGAVRRDVTAEEVAALIGGTCGAVVHGSLGQQARDRLACVVCDGLRASAPPARS